MIFTAATAIQAGAFYAGFLSLTVNQRTVIPYWDLAKHLRVPVSQNAGVNAVQTAVAAFTAPYHVVQDSVNMADDSMFPVEPNLVFAGNKKHDLTITLPVGIGAIPTNLRIVIIARGILAQNVTPIN